MLFRRTLLFLAALALLRPVAVAAQEPVIEQQVPLDVEGRLLRVSPDLAASLGLFGDLTNVREVLLFRTAGGYVLEITRRQGGVLVRERQPMSEAAVAALRSEVSRRLAERAPSALIDRSGRYLLLATTTAAGLGFYGLAVPYALGVEDSQAQVGLYMLVSGASFLVPALWSSTRPVSLGMANAAFWGTTRGTIHGLGLHRLIAGEEPDFFVCPGDDFECSERARADAERYDRTQVASALAGSLIEAVAATAWARSADATAGDAHLVGISSDLGALAALGTGVLLGIDNTSALWGFSLSGAAAGLGGGVLLRNHRDHSWGDAEVFRTAGLLGGYIGATAAELVGVDDPEPFAGLVLAGGAAGLVLGDRVVRGREISAGQGLLVDLGTVAGGLLGLGFAVLVGDDASLDATVPLVLSSLGASLGFAITLNTLADTRPDALEPGPRPDPDPGSDRRDLDLALDLVPFPNGARGGSTLLPPLGLRLRYRF